MLHLITKTMKAEQCSLTREVAAFQIAPRVAHHLCSQADFHCTLCHRGQVGIRELVENAENILFVPFVYI